VLPSSSSA
jgi:hypothetical protein